jgi:hypothetical protein
MTRREWIGGIAVVLVVGVPVGIARSVWDWSDGLTVLVAGMAMFIAGMVAWPDDRRAIFGRSPRSD